VALASLDESEWLEITRSGLSCIVSVEKSNPALPRLSDLAPGMSARVKTFPSAGATFLRLREMGLVPGTSITFVRRAPLGDPLEFKLRGYHLTLRRDEADQIVVEKLETP
jgi:ferrous iron transport protein A